MKEQIVFFTLCILVIVELYFYRAVHATTFRLPKPRKYGFRIAYFVLTITQVVILLLMLIPNQLHTPLLRFMLGIVMVILISKTLGLVFVLLSDISFVLRKCLKSVKISDQKGRRTFLEKTALLTASIPFLTFMYGIFRTAYNIKVFKQTVNISTLPKVLETLRIVQISDLHLGSFLSKDPIVNIVNQINNLNPDMVFFTGDLVNNISEEALPFVEELKRIKTTYGIYSILGNHDYGDYYYKKEDVEGKRHNKILMTQIHKSLGWKLLLNQSETISIGAHALSILGVENWGDRSRFPKYGDIDKVLETVPKEAVKILLSHDPSHFQKVIQGKYPQIVLTLSGHTHGMQFGIEIPGIIKWSPSKYLYKYWAGLYTFGTQHIYVNRGVGFLGYPGRVGIKPEITLLKLKSL